MEDSMPKARWTLAQPGRGLFGFAVTFALSLVITVSFGMDSYLGLLTLWIMAMVPLELVMTIGWGVKYPPTDFLPQPWRGFLLTAFMFLIGTVICFAVLRFVGAGAPQPVTSAFAICTVILTVVAVAAFGMWPFRSLSVPARGFLTLIAVYLVVFYGIKLFDFSVLSYPAGVNPSPTGPAPFYDAGGPLAAFAGIAPKGPIPWETGMTVWFWVAPLIFTSLLLELWPLNKSPRLMKQPTLGVILFAVCAAGSYILYRIGVGILQIEPLRFMYCGVSYAFGVLLILVLFQRWPGRMIRGPAGAFLNIGLAIVIAYAGYHAVGAICEWHFGKAMVYPANLFAMGNFMLGLNFPLWVAYADIWDFWPLPSTPAPAAAR
jgi:hypothetical protein